MIMVKMMIRTKKKSSFSLAITTSGLSPPVLALLPKILSKEGANCGQILIRA